MAARATGNVQDAAQVELKKIVGLPLVLMSFYGEKIAVWQLVGVHGRHVAAPEQTGVITELGVGVTPPACRRRCEIEA